MTRRVSSSEQGQLQGAIASLTGIAGLLGPSLFTQTFAAFIGPQADWHFPGAPYLIVDDDPVAWGGRCLASDESSPVG